MRWVYPRPRGEYAQQGGVVARSEGLPPPTRGIPRARRCSRFRTRSTPAHAGNTCARPVWTGALEVYPRPRGEYSRLRPAVRSCIGLPPPTRGIQKHAAHAVYRVRSTPAHAGNTHPHAAILRVSMVYPRPRGEYASNITSTVIHYGLPPPTRGIHHARLQQRGRHRSTPAHAGNTVWASDIHKQKEVYPRPRGEYPRVVRVGAARRGLPPPTRGIPTFISALISLQRSTPAHAGNTGLNASPNLPSAVYPRPRGEYHRPIRYGRLDKGLPPPTRGIPSPYPLWAA